MNSLTKRLRCCAAGLLVLGIAHLAPAAEDGEHAKASMPTTVSTFESIGIYWKAGPDAPGGECAVRYRAKGSEQWREALPLWYDKRNSEYRGSIMNLKQGTAYEIGLRPKGAKEWTAVSAGTWSEDFPIERTVTLAPGTRSTPLVITEGGKPGGFVLYTVRPGQTNPQHQRLLSRKVPRHWRRSMP